MGTGTNVTGSWMGILLLPEATYTKGTTEIYNRMITQYILLMFWPKRGSLEQRNGNVSQKENNTIQGGARCLIKGLNMFLIFKYREKGFT